MNIWLLIIIGVSLSMDTFSLALSLGTFNISIKKGLFFALLVGFFHLTMPLLGNLLGKSLQNIISVGHNKLLFIIFLFLAIQMTIDLFFKDKKDYNLGVFNMFLVAFSVSIDSLTIGLGLKNVTSMPFLGASLFAFIAFVFTYIGIVLGKYSYQKLGKTSKVIGLLIILILVIIHFFK